MKKTLIALMTLAGIACGAETVTPTINSGRYTLNMSSAYTLHAPELYNYLYGVFVEGGTLTFDLNIAYTGASATATEALLHVGGEGTGLSIYAINGTSLQICEKNDTSLGSTIAAGLTEGTSAVAITLTGNANTKTADVSVSVNGGDTIVGTTSLSWSTMNWNTTTDDYGRQCDKYSVNCKAPGWETHQVASITKLTSGTATYKAIPEPATATLSLLALAGLCARRRRA